MSLGHEICLQSPMGKLNEFCHSHKAKQRLFLAEACLEFGIYFMMMMDINDESSKTCQTKQNLKPKQTKTYVMISCLKLKIFSENLIKAHVEICY